MAPACGAVDQLFMSAVFRIRDWLRPPCRVLEESGLRPGMRVLDFGCGTGSYTVAAARIVGPAGEVLAVDASPVATAMVRRRAARAELGNVRTILADRATGIPDASVDFAILYDILHLLDDPATVLGDIRRVLTPCGRLTVSDHHMKGPAVVAAVAAGGRFELVTEGRPGGKLAWLFAPSPA